MTLFHDLISWIATFVNSPSALWVLFALAFAESSFFPIPPDVLMIPLALNRPSLAFVYAAITTLGSVIGGIAGYGLGLKGGRPLLIKLIKAEKIQLVEHLYQRFDVWAVGISAFGPIPYKIFTITAGVFLLNFRRFMFASLLGRAGRFFLIGAVIFILGPKAKVFIENYLGPTIILFTIALVAGFWSLHYFSRYLHRRFHTSSSRTV